MGVKMKNKLIKNVDKKIDRAILGIRIKLIIASKLGRRNIMYAVKKNNWTINDKEDTYLIDSIYSRLKDEGFNVDRDELPCWRRLFIGY